MRPQRKRKAPARKANESEAEYEENDGADEKESCADADNGIDKDGNYEPSGDVKSEDKPGNQKNSKPKESKKKRRTKSFDVTTSSDLLPSHARKTKHGGYAHTNMSKSKISKANTGNTPWNKGRNRSSADRAKIAAGVRARNRALLLEKLKRLGLSEEEWLAKKREIKYLRERLRRTKLSNAKHLEAEMKLKAAEEERKLKAAIEVTTEKEVPKPRAELPFEEQVSEVAKEVFTKEVEWTPFSFGEKLGEDYARACSTGGPGGLVCCEACAEKYTLYLSSTVKDMETYRTSRNGREVQELLKFLKQGREKLENACNVARKKIPPLPPKPPASAPKPPSSSRKNAPATPDPGQWNMTSAIDLSATEGLSITI